MIKNKNSQVRFVYGLLIGIFILSFVFFSLVSADTFSKESFILSEKKTDIDVIDNSSSFNINVSRWNKKVFLSIDRVYSSDDLVDRYYSLDDDNFEYEVEFSAIPSQYYLEFDLDFPDGLEFYYQPPLNIEMNNISCNSTDCQDSHRPLNVVGSYAVYWNEGNNQYMTGKFAHIYRPELIDAKGNRAWANMSISKDVMRIDMPKEFIDNANYPLILDPILGFTGIGGTNAQTTADTEHAYGPFQNATGGTISSINWYVTSLSNTPITLGVFDDNGGNPDANLRDTAGAVETSDGWINQALDSSLTISGGTDYWFGQNHDDDNTIRHYYDSVSGFSVWWEYPVAYSGGSLSANYPIAGATEITTRKYSIYATITAGGDSTNPSVTINTPLTQNYSTSTIDFNITATDDTLMDSCWVTTDSGVSNLTLTNTTTNDDYNATNSSMITGVYTAQFYCNDSSNNVNNTESVVFEINSCVPPTSGNWGIDCSDNCTWTSNQEVPGNITIIGGGKLSLQANFSFTNPPGQIINIISGGGCDFVIYSGGGFS